METFVTVMFWVFLIEVIIKLVVIATGESRKPVSLNVYIADTVLIAIFCIWAGFSLWY